MEFDVFFSVSQTPVAGKTPSEAEMYRNFLAEVEAADALGFGVAWLAESHLSSEVQKKNRNPVIPHWQGEVGLNVDFLQLTNHVFRRTKRIECGSAIMNVVYGSPIVAAERVAAFLALHGLDPEERRRIHVGFAAGRFEFMNRATGIVPRDPIEEAGWPVVKGLLFREAAEIFCRLLRGDVIEGQDIEHPVLREDQFRRPADWKRVQEVAKTTASSIPLRRRWDFEALQIVPKEWRRDLLQLTIGSHDPEVQEFVNRFLPVRVFNLSITQPEVIEDTHRRLTACYHPDGGPWKRSYMPRTTFVFLDATPGRSPEKQREAARERARMALGAYWTALEGTLDPNKVDNAADNALVGNPDDVAGQILDRFHAGDRLMLWFDFFEHDAARVVADMEAFVAHVAPKVRAALGAA